MNTSAKTKLASILATGVLALTGAIVTAPAVTAQPVESAVLATSGLGALGYPNFTTSEFSGRGTRVIRLPAARRSAIVTATHNGRSNFVIWGLDADNRRNDLIFNEIGEVDGSRGLNLSQSTWHAATRSLEVQADGDWTIKVESVNNAPALPRSGSGSGVYRWNNPATTWTIRNTGRSNFIIWQHFREPRFGLTGRLLVNEIGNWNGSVPAQRGPSIVEIRSDGNWRIDR